MAKQQRFLTRMANTAGLFIGFMLWFSYAAASPLLSAKYEAKHSGMNIEIIRTLEHTSSGDYLYKFHADSALAKIKESSRFQFEGGVIKPLQYDYYRTVFGIGKKESINFDWQTLTASYQKKSKQVATIPIKSGILDSSLYQLQLQKDLYNNKEKLAYTYVQRDTVKQRNFEALQETEFQIKDKKYSALKLRRISNKADKNTEVIVIPELMYLIASIKQFDDGDEHETRLVDFSLNREKLAKIYGE